ncbi:response regulator transcription factor [Nitrosomonas sp. Nm34]|uniref:response regulator n=1 Tax=Nitrosomonas sp. Nm34 TaxID=1881055 RepID=UPI0008DFD428|nr:response regulator transcription factor [Nitrosomonas sp. Nm34]SFI49238.1 two-component system, NarL family, invasion response regulator UvrY [Nitrosomonas sp. Nm34]
MREKPITVLLIDDHPVVRNGYRRLLESTADIHVVADADNGETGCTLHQEHKPDVTIIDLNLDSQGIDGLETIHRIKTKNPAANILVFSMYSNEIMVQRALNMGATGYITKQSSLEQLLEAVRKVSQGRVYIDQELASNLLTDKWSGKPSENPLDVLSKREFQLFKLIAEGNSVAQIAEMISISPKTVGVHQASIMKKLKLKNSSQLVRLAINCHVIQP